MLIDTSGQAMIETQIRRFGGKRRICSRRKSCEGVGDLRMLPHSGCYLVYDSV